MTLVGVWGWGPAVACDMGAGCPCRTHYAVMLTCALVSYCRLGWLLSLGCAMVAWLSCFHAEKVWPHRHPNPSSRRKGGWTRPRLVLPRSTPVLLPKVAASIPAARSSWAGCSSTPPPRINASPASSPSSSDEHTTELQALMRTPDASFCTQTKK